MQEEPKMTVDDVFKSGTEKIGKREAKLLLSHITGYSTSGLMLHGRKEIDAGDYNLYLSCLKRRQLGEPLQYIIGQWEFMGISLISDKRALIPRPETELLVEEALKFIERKLEALRISNAESTVRTLDVCTGSGCIALAIACLVGKQAEIIATDISNEALSLAKENASKLGVSAERVSFIQSDLINAVEGKFDVIISNPPYILSSDMSTLPLSVRDHEPHQALDGGQDGLDFYRRLIPQSFQKLSDGGALFLEIGPAAVMDLMKKAGFENINLRRDYAESKRIVSGVKPCLTV